MERLTLQAAADQLGISKKTLWRAVKAGKLKASKVETGSSWEYQVAPADLAEYRTPETVSRSNVAPSPPSPPPATSPPLELYLEMLDRLQRAERRAVELELALQQSQRLLTENAESIVESAAKVREAEAKADQLVNALEATKPTRRRSRWFSWLTLRGSAKSEVESA